MTKSQFLMAYETELKQRYDWAADGVKLARFMDSARHSIKGTTPWTWNNDGPAVVAAWRAIGCTGKPTQKALRALPD